MSSPFYRSPPSSSMVRISRLASTPSSWMVISRASRRACRVSCRFCSCRCRAAAVQSSIPNFPGALSLSATTVIRAWTELAECVFRAGCRKLVLLNSHGGNVGILDIIAHDLRARLGMFVGDGFMASFRRAGRALFRRGKDAWRSRRRHGDIAHAEFSSRPRAP